MREVLILSPTFPPQSSLDGLRVLKFAKYLPTFGWIPTVVTADFRDPDAPFTWKASPSAPLTLFEFDRTLEKFFDVIRITGLPRIPRMQKNVARLREIIQNKNIRLITSAGDDHLVHLLAMRLKKSLRLPWIADLSMVAMQPKESNLMALFPYLFRQLMENLWLRSADEIITPSPAAAGRLYTRKMARSIEVVFNGFENSEYDQAEEGHQRHRPFSIVLSEGRPEASKAKRGFWQAMDELIQEGSLDPSRINLTYLTEESRPAPRDLPFPTQNLSTASSERIASALTSASLVVLDTTTPGSNRLLAHLIFPMLASRRPLIVVAENGSEEVDDDILQILLEEEGIEILAPQDIRSLRANIVSRYKDSINGAAKPLERSPEIFQNFSQVTTTEHLASIFNRTVEQ